MHIKSAGVSGGLLIIVGISLSTESSAHKSFPPLKDKYIPSIGIGNSGAGLVHMSEANLCFQYRELHLRSAGKIYSLSNRGNSANALIMPKSGLLGRDRWSNRGPIEVAKVRRSFIDFLRR